MKKERIKTKETKKPKVKKELEKLPAKVEEKPLALMTLAQSASGAVDLKKAQDEMPQGNFLPFLFLANKKSAIEPGIKTGFMILKENSVNFPLEGQYFLVHILSREFCRRLEGEKYVDRCYAPVTVKNESEEAFEKAVGEIEEAEENEEETAWQNGFCHLVCVIADKGDKIAFATLESAGKARDFWTPALAGASLADQRAVRIDEADFAYTQTTSKAGFEYYASWKFTRYTHDGLPATAEEKIKEQYQKQYDQITAFLAK